MAVEILSTEDKEFLSKCEEEFKDRYTENDEEFMKVFNAKPSTPPIIESWWVPNNSRGGNNRFNRHHPYERRHNDDRDSDHRPRYNNQYQNDNRGNRNHNYRPRHHY